MQQIRLDHIHDGVGFFANRSRDGVQSYRAPVIFLDDSSQHAAVDIVQPKRIDLQQIERFLRYLARDRPISAHLGIVTYAAQQSQGDTRRATRAMTHFFDPALIAGNLQHIRSAPDDSLHGIQIIVIQSINRSEPGPQRSRDQRQPRSRADDGEMRQLQADGTRRGPLAYDDVQCEIFHSRVENFLHSPSQPVDFIDEKYIPRAQVGQDGG